MSEIYWITRFGYIHGLGIATLIVSGMILVIALVTWVINSDEDYDFETRSIKAAIRVIKYTIVPFIVGILLTVFIPSTKEALLIYGVGGTIDYIKLNPTAKQIPDKCINALDKWVDSWSNKEEKNEKMETSE